MAIAPSVPPPIGGLLRDWRQRRRMSQLDLAVEAEVSARHLSFVETGRARPSRELVLHLAGHLDVPLRERNALLLAAGYAPTFRETALDAAEMAPVRSALDQLLRSHEPFPAIAVDARWDLVSANQAALAILADGVHPRLLEPPVNALRVTMHPDGLAPRIVNFAAYSAHLLERLGRQTAFSGDPALGELMRELSALPGVGRDPSGDAASALFVPLVLRVGEETWTFFSTLTSFGTALDITVAGLAIESFFPADEATAAAVRRRAPGSN